MRIIIAGSRDFNDVEMLNKEVLKVLNILYLESNNKLRRKDIEMISGTANGADKLGESFAKHYNIKLTLFPADWNKYGKSAGYKRNKQMSLYAKENNGVLIAFWNGTSKGTKLMIDIAKEDALQVFVIKTDTK